VTVESAPGVSRVQCPHAARCPGCPLIDRPYEEQLDHKRDVLSRALAAYPLLAAAPVAATVPADPVTGFRVRAKLVVSGSALGLFARGTHEVVDIPECLVLRPRLHGIVTALRASLPLPGPVSSFDLREADAGVLVTAAVPLDFPAEGRRSLSEHIAGLDANVASVALRTRDEDAPQLLGGALEVLVGPSELRHQPDPTAPWHYAAHGAFTQAHAGQLARLHGAIEAELRREYVLRGAGGTERALAGLKVLELYAGSGALALALAAHGAEVTLVESFAPAVHTVERAAAEQRLTLRPLTADAGVALGNLAEEHAHFDAVIVDPPRRGLAPEVRRRIAALRPALLLYVSCAPDTLARDASHLALLGYGLEGVTPLDMIPLSDAVEALARLVPREPPRPRVLASDTTFVAVDKAPHERVAGKDAPSLLERVRQLPDASGATSVDALDPGASGVCVFARHVNAVNDATRVLQASSAEYLCLVRGVMHERGTLSLKSRGGARARYERLEVLGGHSLLRVTAPVSALGPLCRALASLRHPVLGEGRYGDRRANVHFSHRHELDRPFLHRLALTLALPTGPLRLESPLGPDLACVLASLRALPAPAAPRAKSRPRGPRA
jgi:23S rRNA (uracil1939-C5)-methyltransferase